ncbi:MAG: O-methyltransferase [Armatimonadetes bacterium]|nr:O-methyltransferase [Armatimonadota bacterium]
MGSQLTPKLTEYLEELEASGNGVVAEMEALAAKEGFPIVGPQCGRVLATLALAIGANRVFEMGSGFGYSTYWFASAVGPHGEVVHTDWDEANGELARRFLDRSGLERRCRFMSGDAVELLAQEPLPFDCIFLDIDKVEYPRALKVAVSKLRRRGLLIAHNVVWSGRVAEESDDPETAALRQYNKEIMEHPELLSFINPVHDGLAISLKVDPEVRSRVPV